LVRWNCGRFFCIIFIPHPQQIHQSNKIKNNNNNTKIDPTMLDLRPLFVSLVLGSAATFVSADTSAFVSLQSNRNDFPGNLRPSNNNPSSEHRQRYLQDATAATVSSYWDTSEDVQATYVHFNDTMKAYIDTEFNELYKDSPDVKVCSHFLF